jgi:hypothetical protein
MELELQLLQFQLKAERRLALLHLVVGVQPPLLQALILAVVALVLLQLLLALIQTLILLGGMLVVQIYQ